MLPTVDDHPRSRLRAGAITVDLAQMLVVAAGAFLAGAMNAVAGGGTFFSFPALLAVGVPPITANATNTVALCPASLASAWAYRDEAVRHKRRALTLVVISIVGGIAGSLLLLATSDQAFTELIPWLLLAATLLFAASRKLSDLVALQKRVSRVFGTALQLPVAVYGGFFGAGLGILTLSALSVQGIKDVQELNALKNLASAVNYMIAAVIFMVSGAISWPHALVMISTSVLGGHFGAVLARHLSSSWLRRIIVSIGVPLRTEDVTRSCPAPR